MAPRPTKPMRTVALLALAASVLAACGDDAGEDAVQPDTTTSTTAASTTTTTTATTTTGGSGGGDPAPTGEEAVATVQAWVGALAENDLDAAWELVAERSREAVGDFEGFSDLGSALAEGFGAWATAGDGAFSAVPVDTEGNEGLSVVILSGTIPQEGPPAPAADAVPVRTTDDGSLVEPFLDLGSVEHQPPPGTAIPAQPTFEAVVPVAADVRFVVDDRGAEVPATEGADGDQHRASLAVDPALEPGPHSLTVVLTTPEGDVSTSTALYSVEG